MPRIIAGDEEEDDISNATEIRGRKKDVFEAAERMASSRADWIERNRAYYGDDRRYLRFIVPEGARVLDLGCGTGSLLASLKPSKGVGIDFAPAMIREARQAYPHLDFVLGDVESSDVLSAVGQQDFEFIILSDTIGMLEDIDDTLRSLHALCSPSTRIIIAYFSPLWGPLADWATKIGWRMPQPDVSRISRNDFLNIMDLTGFEVIRMEMRQLVPFDLFGLGRLINRYIAPLPIVRKLCLRTYLIARSLEGRQTADMPSVSILIPCRNESGNIEQAIIDMPRFGSHQEIIFVEGNSSDDTHAKCLEMQARYAQAWDIKVLQQDGKGKGDAVRKGFDAATGDVLMILDADLTVPPSALPKFYNAIATGKGEFINGTRLVYPMEAGAMRSLNLIANHIFAKIFSFLLNQRFTDTLCGTKVLTRDAYRQIAKGRSYFGDFDPFGDFDLIFGAAKQSRRIIEVPVHYKARTFGEPQISRFRDGWLLLRMVVFAYQKLKAI